MKISNSKKQLAKIISENGGWRDGVEFSISTCDGVVIGSRSKPRYTTKYGWVANGGFFEDRIKLRSYLKNWHQTVLARDEYFHLYPAPDADGWIEWKGGERPIDALCLIEARVRNGEVVRGYSAISHNWVHDGSCRDIVAYRLLKLELQQYCEPVTQSIPDQPTIEQLAAEYRNRKDYAERKQQEADKANMESDAALSELERAIAEIGFAITPIGADAKEPELVITDWRDLRVGDEIEYVDGSLDYMVGVTGVVVDFDEDHPRAQVRMASEFINKHHQAWPSKWRFIRRP